MIDELQKAMLEESQVDMLTLHNFADGCYARTIIVPKGVCLVGAKHKTQHFLMISKGRGQMVANDGEPESYEAPQMMITQPGTKRVIVAEEETYLTTFHVTEETDIEKIGHTILEPETDCLPQWQMKALGGIH